MIASDLLQSILAAFRGSPECTKITVLSRPNSRNELPNSASVCLHFAENELYGYGHAETKDEAAFIAVMELAERFVFQYSQPHNFSIACELDIKLPLGPITDLYPGARNWVGRTSNGLAIHTNKKACIESAISEAVERHVVLKALVEKIKPASLSLPRIANNYLIASDLKLEFFGWRGPLDRFVVVARVCSESGTCYGFGCSQSLEHAKNKAFLELSPRISALNLRALLGDEINSSNENFAFHFSGKSAPSASALFSDCIYNEMPSLDEDLSMNDIWVREYPIPPILSHLGLVAFQAASPLLQPLFAGPWSTLVVNPLAIPQNQSLPIEHHMIG